MGAKASTGRAAGRAAAEVQKLQQAKPLPAVVPHVSAPAPPSAAVAAGDQFNMRDDSLIEAMNKLRIVQRTEIVDPRLRKPVQEVVALSARKGMDKWSQLTVDETRSLFREAGEGATVEELCQRYNAPADIVRNALKFSSLPRIREVRDDVGRKIFRADA